MQVTFLTYLIICPLVLLAGFVDSVAGGGGVISLPAYLIAGIPIKMAAGTNKFANGCGTALACFNYAKSGNVDWLCALPAAVTSLIGSAIATTIAVFMRDDILQGLVLIALPLVAVFLFFTRRQEAAEEKPYSKLKVTVIASFIGLAIGMYDGLVGPGTGTFLTLCFSGFLGYSLLKSSGCARVANLASNIASIVVYFTGGKILFAVAIPAMVCAMTGAQLGSRFAIRGGSRNIRFIMFIVLGLLFLKVGLNFLGVIDF